MQIIDTDSTTPVTASVGNEVWLVKQGVTLATQGSAIEASAAASNRSFFIEGHLAVQTGAGVNLGAGSLNRVFVGESGSIASSSTGIQLYSPLTGDASVRNDGDVYGLSYGVFADIDRFGLVNNGTIGGFSGVVSRSNYNTIVNNGIINGAVATYARSAGNTSVNNTGTINGSVWVETDASETNTIFNSGTISSEYAVLSSGGIERVTNTGTMNGNLLLGGGSDTLSNSGTIRGTVSFEDGNDSLTLNDGGVIDGDVNMGDGSDYLYLIGGSVTGQVSGGLGDDVYIVSKTDALLSEFFNQGTDTVQARTTWHLGDNFEHLMLAGSANAAIDGHGNALANIIRGNQAANQLFGYEGNDELIGGRGADLLDGGTGKDTASYASAGADTTIDLTTGIARGGDAQGDRLVGIENVWGSTFADRLTGNKVANELLGGAGNDRLDGRAGNDFLEGGTGKDVFVFTKGYGKDTIADFTLAGSDADVVDLRGVEGVANFRDLIRNHLQAQGDDAVFTFDDGGSLVLKDLGDARFRVDYFLL